MCLGSRELSCLMLASVFTNHSVFASKQNLGDIGIFQVKFEMFSLHKLAFQHLGYIADTVKSVVCMLRTSLARVIATSWRNGMKEECWIATMLNTQLIGPSFGVVGHYVIS